MLVDSGFTHNFLDLSTAKSLGCHMLHISSHVVSVAGEGNYNVILFIITLPG